jgi:hypothetical protein
LDISAKDIHSGVPPSQLFGEKDMALEKVGLDPFDVLFGSEIPLFGDCCRRGDDLLDFEEHR